MQFDLIAEEARKSNLEIDALFNDEYQLPQPPAKKRKLTRELSKDPLTPSEPTEPVCEQGPCPISLGNSNKASKPLAPLVCNSPYTHDTSLYNSPCSSTIPFYISPYDRSAFVYKSPYANAASVRNSPYGSTASGEASTTSASLQPLKPLDEVNVLVAAAKNANLLPEHEQPSVVDLRDEVPETQSVDDAGDDGSLFGDYVSSKQSSVDYWPVAEPSLEGANTEVELRATNTSSTPALLWDPNVPIPSVERDLPPTNGSYNTFKVPLVNKTTHPSSVGPGLVNSDKKGGQVFPDRSVPNSVGEAQNGICAPEKYQGEISTSSTLPYCRNSLPLCISLALTTPETTESVDDTIRSAKSSITSQSSPKSSLATHQVPEHLAKLLDSLHLKYNQDKAFRDSTLKWLVTKLVSSGAQIGGHGDELSDRHVADIFHHAEIIRLHSHVQRLQDDLQQTNDKANRWENAYGRVARELETVKKELALWQEKHRK